jgi:threonine/homoserine/homoserine lactone efflux protein
MLGALLGGLLLGFLGSMPIAGPISALVVQRALECRARAGIYLASGSAVAEALYAFVAFWGYAAFLGRHPDLLPASRLVGGLVLVALGVYFLSRNVRRGSPTPTAGRDGRAALLGFTMTIANPTLIVTWTACTRRGSCASMRVTPFSSPLVRRSASSGGSASWCSSSSACPGGAP